MDGKTSHTIRENVPHLAAPAWSPDGERFAFADFGDKPGQLQLAIALPDGTVIQRIAPGVEGLDIFPAWSPDGRRIAYVHAENEKDARADLMIYDVNKGTHSVVSRGTLIYGFEDIRPAWGRASSLERPNTAATSPSFRTTPDDGAARTGSVQGEGPSRETRPAGEGDAVQQRGGQR
jgi:dipeptidyl aminopeptidase/acylaminoacyl peptidase